MSVSSFRLIRQQIAETLQWDGVVDVPAGPSRWDGAALQPAQGWADAVVFEPAAAGVTPVLLMYAPPGAHVRVNGRPVPLASLVRVGDEIALEERWRLHVTVHRPAPASIATDADARRACPVCRGAIGAGERVFRCGCGTLMHWGEGDDAMDCAAVVRQCPLCRAAVRNEGGYAWRPEGFDA